MSNTRTILMYARSRGGKTTLVDELAQDLYVKTGKPSLIYFIDKGGIGPYRPSIKLGIIELIEQLNTDPWFFLSKAAQGYVRDAQGKWVKADISKYAMVGYESMTAFSDEFMNSLAEKAAGGLNIGGQGGVSITINGDNNESLKIGGNNMSHYNVVQTRILSEIWKSQKLTVPYVVWTASQSKDDDQNAGGKVLGPAIAGKAMTAELLRQFDLTFRLDCSPAQGTTPEKHTLYLGNSVDIASGNAVALGNTRIPLAQGVKELPSKIEPASLVGALNLIAKAEEEAEQVIRKKIEATKVAK